jgi:hypothetical protein
VGLGRTFRRCGGFPALRLALVALARHYRMTAEAVGERESHQQRVQKGPHWPSKRTAGHGHVDAIDPIQKSGLIDSPARQAWI